MAGFVPLRPLRWGRMPQSSSCGTDAEMIPHQPGPQRAPGGRQREARGAHAWPVFFRPSMVIYYLQSIARSLKLSNQQLRMQIQNVSTASSLPW